MSDVDFTLPTYLNQMAEQVTLPIVAQLEAENAAELRSLEALLMKKLGKKGRAAYYQIDLVVTEQASLIRRLAFVEGLRYGMALAGLDAPDPTQYQTVEIFDGE